MAILDSFVENPQDGDQVNDGFMTGIIQNTFKHAGSDQTGGTANNEAEKEVGEVTITANTVTNGILVLACGTFSTSGTSQAIIKLRAGTSTTGTSNTTYKTITLSPGSGNDECTGGWNYLSY